MLLQHVHAFIPVTRGALPSPVLAPALAAGPAVLLRAAAIAEPAPRPLLLLTKHLGVNQLLAVDAHNGLVLGDVEPDHGGLVSLVHIAETVAALRRYAGRCLV